MPSSASVDVSAISPRRRPQRTPEPRQLTK
jgi:hypothetical protein